MANIGLGATLTIGAVAVSEATNIQFGGVMADAIESTNLGTTTARTYVPGLVNSGTISWSANYDSTKFASLKALVGTDATCQIDSPSADDQRFTFNAIVTKLDVGFETQTLISMNGELQVNGDITVASIP